MVNIFSKIPYEAEKNHDLMLVMVTKSEGSTPRGAGSLMLVGEEKQIMGTIGGGAIEKKSEQMAVSMLKKKESGIREFVLNDQDKDELGMVCGGNATVYFQFIDHSEPAWGRVCAEVTDRAANKTGGKVVIHLDGTPADVVDADANVEGDVFCLAIPVGERAILFGGGHCAYALVPVLASVGFRVTVFDDRPEFVEAGRFPQAEKTICGDFTKINEYIDIKPDDYIVVMTSGHYHDYEVQEQVLRKDFTYVGVVGSKSKKAAVNAKLMADGIPEETIARVHTPIGISIKSVTPEEIAISIAGEMILERATTRQSMGVGEIAGCPMHNAKA